MANFNADPFDAFSELESKIEILDLDRKDSVRIANRSNSKEVL